jgi:hypothetical protein
MTTPKVSPDMITIVIIEPTPEFWTSGRTWPLLGSKYQKLMAATTINAAPEIIEDIS